MSDRQKLCCECVNKLVQLTSNAGKNYVEFPITENKNITTDKFDSYQFNQKIASVRELQASYFNVIILHKPLSLIRAFYRQRF